MMPRAIVNAIEARLGITGGPCEIRDAIERELLASGETAAAAAEQIDQVRTKVIAEITRRREERDDTGEIAVLHLRGTQGNIVHGSSFVFADDPQTIKQSKKNRIAVNDIYLRIRNLDFGQFEVFGRSVLRELGCKTAKVTPHAGDQGIAFTVT